MLIRIYWCRWINEAYRRPRLAAHPDGSTTSKPGRPRMFVARILAGFCLLYGSPHENPCQTAPVVGAPARVARRLRPFVRLRARIGVAGGPGRFGGTRPQRG